MHFLIFFWREFKADKKFNLFTVLCVSLGIIGLLLVESFKVGVEEKVANNAKNFIAGDLSISSRRFLTAEENKNIDKIANSENAQLANWIETYSLVSKSTENNSNRLSKLANINFVSKEFPFYGGLTLEEIGFQGPGQFKQLHQEQNAWISRDLAWQLDAKLNDNIKIGELFFKVKGIITEDKFSSFRGFNLAPKIFISESFLAKTQLVKFGSTANYATIFKLSDPKRLKIIQSKIKADIADKTIKILGPQESSRQIARALELLADYLSLITLITYLLSLVGLYYFTQHFLSKKLKNLSIYKTLGIKTFFLFKINFFHLVILSFIALIFSTILTLIGLPFAESFFSKMVGDDLNFRLSLFSLMKILLLSFGGSLLALGPLFWGALQTPIATIFQDIPFQLNRIKFYFFAPLIFYITFLAIKLSNSIKTGSYFTLALFSIIILSAILFKIFCFLLNKFANHFHFTIRHSAKTMSRYFSSSFTIFICLLISMTFIIFIFQIDHSLRQEFTSNSNNKRPDIFLFDLQDNQEEKFANLVIKEKWNQNILAPMIRGRLIKINNNSTQKKEETQNSEFITREDENSERMKNRGVNLSYRNKLSWSEKIVAGQFNENQCFPDIKICEISLEESYAKQLGVKLLDKLTFDVSGIEIQGQVTSFRKVKWTSFEPNFFILFQKGILESAPKAFLGSFKLNSDIEKRKLFNQMANFFPNVSLIEVSELVKKITAIFDLMSMAIKFVSLLSLFVALVVLVAVSFNHLELRRREMALYYMIGLKRKIIKNIFLGEFGFIILICMLLSLLFGSTLSTLLMKVIFDTEAILRLPFIFTTTFIISSFLILIVQVRLRILIKKRGNI